MLTISFLSSLSSALTFHLEHTWSIGPMQLWHDSNATFPLIYTFFLVSRFWFNLHFRLIKVAWSCIVKDKLGVQGGARSWKGAQRVQGDAVGPSQQQPSQQQPRHTLADQSILWQTKAFWHPWLQEHVKASLKGKEKWRFRWSCDLLCLVTINLISIISNTSICIMLWCWSKKNYLHLQSASQPFYVVTFYGNFNCSVYSIIALVCLLYEFGIVWAALSCSDYVSVILSHAVWAEWRSQKDALLALNSPWHEELSSYLTRPSKMGVQHRDPSGTNCLPGHMEGF